MARITIFLPLFAVFLAMITSFAMGTSFAEVVSTVSWMGWGSSGLRGFNPMAVMLVDFVPKGGMRYQNRNTNDMLGNTSVAKTC